MAYYNDENAERRSYENWHRFGSERGFFDRASDEIRSWFGDQDAEYRRRRDQAVEGRTSRLRRGTRPEWQGRGYSGASPRGSGMSELGRYDEPSRRGTAPSRRMPYFSRGEETGSWRQYRQDQYTPDYDRAEWERSGEEAYRQGQPNWFGTQPADDDYERRRLRQWYEDHTGRGPRAYQRSDDRILDAINEKLHWHPGLDATDIDVAVNSGIVTLKGTVDCRRSKNLAEDIAEDVYGVKEVHNELHVGRRTETTNQQELPSRGVLSR